MFFAERSWRRCPSNSSAGGQLEHPSEVNNSTTTALRGRPASVVLAITAIQIEITATTSIASAKIRLMRIRSTTLRFVAVFLGGGQFQALKNLPLSKLLCTPTPLMPLLLQTKGKVHFDRAVTGRSKPLFRFESPSNLDQFFRSSQLPILLFD